MSYSVTKKKVSSVGRLYYLKRTYLNDKITFRKVYILDEK